MDPHDESWVGRVLEGRYRVEAALRAGGMGAVYRGVDLKMGGAEVVVKHPLRPAGGTHSDTQDKDLRKRFTAEVAKLIALRDLPGVVRITDQGVEGGTPFYVMDFMAGGSLHDRLQRRPDAPGDVLRWAKEVAATLDEIHARGLVHRDIKPQNLLFQRDGGRALIGDFGIVKELAAEWGTTGPANTQIGTPGYMAPEQLLSHMTVDGRCDQFALAATMYVALTGKPLTYETTCGSPAKTPGRAASRKALRPVNAPDMAPHVPVAAAAAVAKGLEPDPDHRHETCAALVDAFEAGLTPAESATATAQRTRRTSTQDPVDTSTPPRRSRAPLVLAALALLGGGGFLGLKALGVVGGGSGGRPKEEARAPVTPPVAPSPPSTPPDEPAKPPDPPPKEPETPPKQPTPPAPSLPAWAVPLLSPAQQDEAARLKVPAAFDEPTTGTRFVLIPGGSFQMGSPDAEEGRFSEEGPQHRVTVPAFYLSIHETTNAQYRRFTPDHKGAFDGDTRPVEKVSHEEATAFAGWLSQQGSGAKKGGYRLPSEAEWEYACRAGTRTRFWSGDAEADLARVGWYTANAGSTTNPVGEKPANPWGLFDMHGNVWEWCADDWHDTYAGAPGDGSAWIDSPRAGSRVLRGGGWDDLLRPLRSATRDGYELSSRDEALGFRLARAVDAPPSKPVAHVTPAAPTKSLWTAPLAEAQAALARDDGEAVRTALARAIALDVPAAEITAFREYLAGWDRPPVLTISAPVKDAEIEAGADGRWQIAVKGTLETGRKGDRLLLEDREIAREASGAFAFTTPRSTAGTVVLTLEVRDGTTLRASGSVSVRLKEKQPPAPPTPPAPSLPSWAVPLLSQAQKDEAARLKVPAAFDEPTTGMRFVLIPGGTFTMGSPESEEDRSSDEGPQHRVTVPAFYMAIHETTNAQYRRFQSDHKGGFEGDTRPVETVSHEEATAYAAWLSQQGDGTTKGSYRLPSEAEWECACRTGTTTRFWSGDAEADLARVGWYSANSGWATHTVGEKPANAWGLFDVHGNVWEWCADDHHSRYTSAPSDGSAWIDSPRAGYRVIRGGGWSYSLQNLRSAGRDRYVPSSRYRYIGFRLARAVTAR